MFKHLIGTLNVLKEDILSSLHLSHNEFNKEDILNFDISTFYVEISCFEKVRNPNEIIVISDESFCETHDIRPEYSEISTIPLHSCAELPKIQENSSKISDSATSIDSFYSCESVAFESSSKEESIAQSSSSTFEKNVKPRHYKNHVPLQMPRFKKKFRISSESSTSSPRRSIRLQNTTSFKTNYRFSSESSSPQRLFRLPRKTSFKRKYQRSSEALSSQSSTGSSQSITSSTTSSDNIERTDSEFEKFRHEKAMSLKNKYIEGQIRKCTIKLEAIDFFDIQLFEIKAVPLEYFIRTYSPFQS